jgi:hypothetical protein
MIASMARPQVAGGEKGLHIWRVAANVLNKQWQKANVGRSSSLGVGLTPPHRLEVKCYETFQSASEFATAHFQFPSSWTHFRPTRPKTSHVILYYSPTLRLEKLNCIHLECMSWVTEHSEKCKKIFINRTSTHINTGKRLTAFRTCPHLFLPSQVQLLSATQLWDKIWTLYESVAKSFRTESITK